MILICLILVVCFSDCCSFFRFFFFNSVLSAQHSLLFRMCVFSDPFTCSNGFKEV